MLHDPPSPVFQISCYFFLPSLSASQRLCNHVSSLHGKLFFMFFPKFLICHSHMSCLALISHPTHVTHVISSRATPCGGTIMFRMLRAIYPCIQCAWKVNFQVFYLFCHMSFLHVIMSHSPCHAALPPIPSISDIMLLLSSIIISITTVI